MKKLAKTNEQDAASRDIDNHSLIIAMAGSGKTKTLIDKVELILSQKITNTVLMVTFTNAAVNEMRERLEIRLSKEDFKRVRVSTFSKVSLQQTKGLMKGRLFIGPMYYNFIERLVSYINSEALLEKGKVKKQDVLDVLAEQYSGEYLEKEDINIIKETYTELKERNHVYDLEDAQARNIEGLKSKEIAPLNVSHLLCDEFQDTNEPQYTWIYEHAKAGSIITAVGDDDQSIYSWRGALSYKLMVKYKNELNPNVHLLTKCFRCRPEIIARTKNMIEFNEDRIPKEMESFKKPGGSVKIYQHLSNRGQYLTFLENHTKIGGEWALLCRTNSLLKEAGVFLTENNIEFTTSNNKSIFDTPAGHFIVKLSCLLLDHNKYANFTGEILGYLKENEDVTALIVGAIKSKNDVKAVLEDNNIEFEKTVFSFLYLNGHLFDESLNLLQVERFANEILEFIIEQRGTDCAIEKSLLTALIGKNKTWKESLATYAERLNPEKETEELNKNIVSLFTFHAAKGLEWENVAIFDVVEGVIPSGKAENTEEERRLMLVGMTRAEERLFIHSYVAWDEEHILPTDDVGYSALYNASKEERVAPGSIPTKNKRVLSRFINEILFEDEEVA